MKPKLKFSLIDVNGLVIACLPRTNEEQRGVLEAMVDHFFRPYRSYHQEYLSVRDLTAIRNEVLRDAERIEQYANREDMEAAQAARADVRAAFAAAYGLIAQYPDQISPELAVKVASQPSALASTTRNDASPAPSQRPQIKADYTPFTKALDSYIASAWSKAMRDHILAAWQDGQYAFAEDGSKTIPGGNHALTVLVVDQKHYAHIYIANDSLPAFQQWETDMHRLMHEHGKARAGKNRPRDSSAPAR